MIAPGLEGVVAAETAIARVDGLAGTAIVRGYSLVDLARTSAYEDVALLLLDGDLPAAPASEAALRPLPGELRAAPGPDAGEAMVAVLAQIEPASTRALAPEERARAVLARVPSAIAVAFGTSIDPEATYARRALEALGATRQDDAACRALETLLVLESEHGFSASTFAARVVASSGAGPGPALAAAAATLLGERHGGATALARDLLVEALSYGDDLGAHVRAWRTSKRRLPGFGHRVYRVADPRVPPLVDAIRSLAAERAPRPPDTHRAPLGGARLLDVAERLDDEVRRAAGARPLHANIDLYGAVLLDALGVPAPRFSAAFALGVAAGWLAHWIEQLATQTLIRPESAYVGPPARPVPVRARVAPT